MCVAPKGLTLTSNTRTPHHFRLGVGILSLPPRTSRSITSTNEN